MNTQRTSRHSSAVSVPSDIRQTYDDFVAWMERTNRLSPDARLQAWSVKYDLAVLRDGGHDSIALRRLALSNIRALAAAMGVKQ